MTETMLVSQWIAWGPYLLMTFELAHLRAKQLVQKVHFSILLNLIYKH